MPTPNHSSSPLISIITINYNNGVYLEQTLLSVIEQDYPNIEYIVIDGGSTDESISIIEKYKDRIDYWVSEKDGGIYPAMNKGIQKATGEIIGIINSSDWLEPNALGIVAEHFRENESVVIHGLCRIIRNEKTLKVNGNTAEFLNTSTVDHPSSFISRKAYEAHGLYNPKYHIAADLDIMNRFHKNGVTFRFVEKILANHRQGGISASSDNFRDIADVLYLHGHIGMPKRVAYYIFSYLHALHKMIRN